MSELRFIFEENKIMTYFLDDSVFIVHNGCVLYPYIFKIVGKIPFRYFNNGEDYYYQVQCRDLSVNSEIFFINPNQLKSVNPQEL